jgi:hypothetical protein
LTVALTNNDTQYRLTAPGAYTKYFWVENENGIYTPLNADLNQNYYDVPVSQSGTPKFITCYAGQATGADFGNTTDGWDLKLRMTQPFIIPGYENAPPALVPSKNTIGYNSTGGTNSFNVTSTNINWEALETTPWFSFQADEDLNGGEGNYPVTVITQPNTSAYSRTGYITLQQEGGGYAQTIEIYQEGLSDCNSAINLTSPIHDFTTSTTKKTATTIQATNKLQTTSTTIDYKAGNAITLNPGFKVDQGVIFKAQIEGCVNDIPWQNTVIGSASGSAVNNSGVLTIESNGDVSGSSDNFQFYQKPFTGDITMTARILNITAIDGMRGGLMIRSNTDQGSKMYELILDGNGNVGKLKRRNPSGAVEFKGYAAMPTANTWLKMTKTGNTIRCYYGSDGIAWTELIGWDDLTDNDISGNFLVGFIAYSAGNTQNCVVSLDNLIVNGVPVN